MYRIFQFYIQKGHGPNTLCLFANVFAILFLLETALSFQTGAVYQSG